MEKQEYIDILKNSKNDNFVGLAITPWHLLGVESAINYLSNQGIDIKGNLYIFSHNETGTCIENESDINIIPTINIVYDKFPKENFKRKIINLLSAIRYLMSNVRKSETFYVICPAKPAWMWIDIILKSIGKRKIVFVIIDEGVGSINFQSFTGLYEANFEGVDKGNISLIHKMKAATLAFFEFVYSDLTIKLLKKRSMYIDNNIFIKKHQKITVNKDILPHYRNVLHKKSENIKKDSKYYDAIVINTQLENDDNYIEEDLFKKCIEFGKTNGIEVVVKPHPRDIKVSRFKEYNCYIENRNKISQEEIIASLDKKPLCIIGSNTTTLLTSKLLFDIPTISLAKIKQNNIKNRDKHLDFFIKLSNGIVMMPENETEFINLLRELIKNEKKEY